MACKTLACRIQIRPATCLPNGNRGDGHPQDRISVWISRGPRQADQMGTVITVEILGYTGHVIKEVHRTKRHVILHRDAAVTVAVGQGNESAVEGRCLSRSAGCFRPTAAVGVGSGWTCRLEPQGADQALFQQQRLLLCGRVCGGDGDPPDLCRDGGIVRFAWRPPSGRGCR
jgi:hypothetical protein